MPRTKEPSYTEVMRREAAKKRQQNRAIKIIDAAARAYEYERAELCQKAHIDYQVFNRRMRAESEFRMSELCGIADALNLDAETRAAICGAKEKCRFEPGYRI